MHICAYITTCRNRDANASMHTCIHTCTHAPTHNVCTQPTHSGAAHAPTHNAPSCVQPRRCNTRYPPSSPCGRCARHTRTFHTSHTDSENGPRAEALFSAATPPGRMDTSSMTAHKAWSHFVDAAMMRWFSSRSPPKIDRGSHDVLCVREAWHGGRIPLPSTSRRCETVGGSMYVVFFALRGGKESVTTQTFVHTVRCRV